MTLSAYFPLFLPNLIVNSARLPYPTETMTATAPPPADSSAGREQTLRGIAQMVTAVFLFSLLNVEVKLLAETYAITQIAFFRNLFALPVAITMVMAHGGPAILRTRHPLGHVWRSLIGLSTMFLIFWSFDLLPLAEATAIWFSGPLFLTVLSVPLLGEKVGVHRWSAVVVGFIGVLVMLRPGSATFQLAALVPLCAAFGYALAMIAVRQLTRWDPTATVVFYFTVCATLFSGLLAPLDWRWPDLSDFLLLAATGLTGGVAQHFLTSAYSKAPAALIGAFNYVNLIFATLFGYLIWGEQLGPTLLLGAGIIMASGLYIIYREAVRRRPIEPPGARPIP